MPVCLFGLKKKLLEVDPDSDPDPFSTQSTFIEVTQNKNFDRARLENPTVTIAIAFVLDKFLFQSL